MHALLRWPRATTLIVALPVMVLLLAAAAGGPGEWAPLWIVTLAVMTPALGIANLAGVLLAPVPGGEVPADG